MWVFVSKKNINQAEGLLTKVEFYFLNQWQTINILNNDKTTLNDVISILIDKAFKSGVEEGIKKGKKEVGSYLKNLIDE